MYKRCPESRCADESRHASQHSRPLFCVMFMRADCPSLEGERHVVSCITTWSRLTPSAGSKSLTSFELKCECVSSVHAERSVLLCQLLTPTALCIYMPLLEWDESIHLNVKKKKIIEIGADMLYCFFMQITAGDVTQRLSSGLHELQLALQNKLT